MKLSYAAFELAVDRLLSSGCVRNARSVFDLPQRDLLKAYNEGLSPEIFTESLQQTTFSKPHEEESSGQSSLF